MSYNKWINSGLLLFSVSSFAQGQIPSAGLSAAMMEDRQALSQTEAGVGKAIEILNTISQADDGTLSVTSKVSSEEIRNATQAIAQRQAALKESSFKKIFITSSTFGRSKKGITLAGKSSVSEIVENIDRLIEESKKVVVAPAPVVEAKVEEKAIEAAPAPIRFYRDEEDERKSREEERKAEQADRERKAEQEIIVLDTSSVTDTKDQALNHSPLAQDLSLEVLRNQEVKGGVVATDLDVDSDPRNLSYKIVKAPENTENFSFNERSGLFSMKPSKSYTGEISFSYVAIDDHSSSNTATVKVQVVKPPKPAPTRMTQMNDLDLSQERQVDLLFVVDSSGSMESAQKALQDSFSKFMKEFGDKKLDVNIAVLTTNGPEFDNRRRQNTPYGAFIGSSMKHINSNKIYSERFLKKDSPVLAEQFKSMALVGTNGDGSETAFLPLIAALSVPNLAGINNGFLRKDALLSIIIISDEDESRNTYGNFFTKDSYVIEDKVEINSVSVLDQRIAALESRLKVLKEGESGRYRMYLVGNDKGKGFTKAVQRFKGRTVSIDSDFSGELLKIAEEVSTLASRSFALKDSAIADSISVTINGEEISETRNTESGDGFSYDEATHSVKLHGTALTKSVGGKVRIKYDYLMEVSEQN
jgi:hypothetical protein